jgi:murein DD-endopeptidase MepM/ murein hydrolase activator NlpD
MCFSRSSRLLVRASLFLAASAALTGCSSDAQRFQSLFGSVQPQYVQPVAAPAQVAAVQPMPQGIDTTATGSIARQAATPVLSKIPRPLAAIGQLFTPASQNAAPTPPALPAPVYAPVSTQTVALPAPVTVAKTPLLAPVAAPVQTPIAAAPVIAPVAPTVPVVAAVPPAIDNTATGAIATTALNKPNGWTAQNGTKVTMREGETVYNLARRFGVPASEILRANGIEKAGSVRSGQVLVIPAYQYSANAPVSAPDSNPDTAMAKSTSGTVFDVPDGRAPLPTPRPADQVAVLPVIPQPKTRAVDPMATGAVAPQAAANAGDQQVAATGPADQPLLQGQTEGRYKVVAGDSLHAIAKKTGVSVGQLRAANGLTDKSVIKIGQMLNLAGQVAAVPGGDGVDGNVTGNRTQQVAADKNIDTLPTASIDPKKTKVATPDAPTTAGSGALRWPVQGPVVTAFRATDNGKANDGIDIDVPAGTAVKAAEGGVVIYSGGGLAEFGNTVLIRHDNGLVTVYGHADTLKVERNQRVNKGDVIALSGASGKAGKPKLHFEVRKNSVPVDPIKFLQ